MPRPPRLSEKQALVLDLLTAHGDSYGLELVRASDGRLKRGTVYVTLDRMEDRGLVESWEAAPSVGHRAPPRRRYRATRPGRAALAAWYDRVAASFVGLRLA